MSNKLNKLWIILCLFLSLPVFAEQKANQPDKYSNVKGDFKIFSLGDSKQIVDEKIKYLLTKGEITIFLKDIYATTVFGKEASFIPAVPKDKLEFILILFKAHYPDDEYNLDLKDFIYKELAPTFNNLYGKPTKNYYPNSINIDHGGSLNVLEWKQTKKTISIEINRGYTGYTVDIYIVNNQFKNEGENKESKDFN